MHKYENLQKLYEEDKRNIASILDDNQLLIREYCTDAEAAELPGLSLSSIKYNRRNPANSFLNLKQAVTRMLGILDEVTKQRNARESEVVQDPIKVAVVLSNPFRAVSGQLREILKTLDGQIDYCNNASPISEDSENRSNDSSSIHAQTRPRFEGTFFTSSSSSREVRTLRNPLVRRILFP